MELITPDSLEATSKRSYVAFRRIGRVKEYNSESHIVGKVFVDGWPAEMRVEWNPYRDELVRIDIAATSDGDLSRAADAAMYRFANAFKHVTIADFTPPRKPLPVSIIVVILGMALVALIVAYALHILPFSG